MGLLKTLTKNPVAERAVEELATQLLRIDSEGGPLSKSMLGIATANLNARVHRDELTAREIWIQRDPFTGHQLPIADREISLANPTTLTARNVKLAMKYNNPHTCYVLEIWYTSTIYERDKTKTRHKYIVTAISGEKCTLRKFTSSQLRGKTYVVPISHCFPIVLYKIAPTPVPMTRKDSDSGDNNAEEDTPNNAKHDVYMIGMIALTCISSNRIQAIGGRRRGTRC